MSLFADCCKMYFISGSHAAQGIYGSGEGKAARHMIPHSRSCGLATSLSKICRESEKTAFIGSILQMKEGATTHSGLQSQSLLQTRILAARSNNTSKLSDAYRISIQSPKTL